MKYSIPQHIIDIIEKLESAGFEGFVVGGAVRDVLMKREPQDWDVATNAQPEQIQKLFPDSVYENTFGTVGVKTQKLRNIETEKLSNLETREKETQKFDSDIVEVTTYRVESGYDDNRHPDTVEFVSTLEEDLARRDFTINAMALKVVGGDMEVVDPFGGQGDIEKSHIRAVGDPSERFQEDALRLMRAVRFGSQLGFAIEQETYTALVQQASSLKHISAERIRDEFVKVIQSPHAAEGIRVLEKTGLLEQSVPELVEGQGVDQNHHHIYTVFDHNVRALEYAVKKDYSLEVRLASLFHDIGKPRSKRGTGDNATFYNHEMIGADMTDTLMKRLKFSNAVREKVVLLVRWHQFYYQSEEVTASSVRRLVKNVGRENTDALLQVREADRIGSGVPKAVPYKLRHLKYMIEQVSTDPISPKMLAVKGDELMKELEIAPGPKLGLIIKALLAEVLDDPSKNTPEALLARACELQTQSEDELKSNLDRIEKAQQQQEDEIKKKYYVQ